MAIYKPGGEENKVLKLIFQERKKSSSEVNMFGERNRIAG